MKDIILILGIAISLLTACQPSHTYPLKEMTKKLSSDMTKDEVIMLFKDFKSKEQAVDQLRDSKSTIYFRGNTPVISKLEFYASKSPKSSDEVETCNVYFDKNNRIVGYDYSHS